MRPPEPLPSDLLAALHAAAGRDGVLTDPGRLLAYESDALTTLRGTPRAVVLPRTRDGLVDVLAALHAHGIPFVPRGAGTGLAGGAVARDAVLVATPRLNRVLHLDPAARTALVEPGVVTAAITAAAAPHGLRYLPDPASGAACTIGGNVAMNSGGPHCLKHGVTSDHVLGVEVVLPDGNVAWLDRGEGGGLDLGGLFVGSEGTLGMASRILVGLAPAAGAVRALLAVFDDIGTAGAAVSGVFTAGVLPVALELIDRSTIELVEASRFAAGLPRDAAAALVIECEGHPHDVDADVGAAADACRGAGAREVTVARDEAQRLAIWQGRKKAYGVLGRAAPDVFVQDAVVPRSELARLLPAIEEVARRQELRLASFFHAGDGNLHPNFLFDRRDPEQVRRVERAGAEVMRLCVEAGGTITGEHGVGSDKVRYMPLVFGPAELAALHAVRAAFDPDGRANPGKLLPADGASAPVTPDEDHAPDASTAPSDPTGPTVRSRSSSSSSPAPAFGAPESEADIRALLADGAGPRARAVTGAVAAPAGAPLPQEGVLSTARLDAIVALRPRDLVVTVGVGVRIEDLARAAEEAGLWLPAGGPGASRSVGGWIAAASPGPWDAAFGPVRRQLLACRIVAFDGRCLAWGRGVVKNVAGYDMPRLVAGSRGRLGILTEVTLRLWPRPRAIAALDLAGEPDRLAAAVLALAGIPPGAEAHDGTLGGVVDGLSWTWTAGEPPRARARLAGPAESVRRRLEILRRAAMERGLHAEASDPWSVPARDRSPESVAFRWAPGRRYVPGALDRLREVAGPALRRAEVLPLSGHVTATLERGVGPADRLPVGPDLLRPWDAASHPSLERGGPEDHAAAKAARDAGPREIERRVVAALGGAARIWQADFI